MTTQTKCRIELLGGIRVLLHNREITRFRTHKTAVLLAYLVLYSNTMHTREQLIERFWPDLDLEAGRNNLSTALSSLRAQLEPPGAKGCLLVADRQRVGFDAAHISTDVQEFLRTLEKARNAEDMRQRTLLLEHALSLYGGELMPGSYEDWVLVEQSRLRDRYADTLRQLAARYGEDEKREDALELVNRLITIDPYDEQAYQLKMRLLAEQGRPAAALETFDSLKTLLHQELEISPSHITLQFAQTLRHNPEALPSVSGPRDPISSPLARSPQRVLPTSSPLQPPQASILLKPDSVRSGRSASASSSFSAVPHALDSNTAKNTKIFLPLQLTRFFGRQRELDCLQTWLRPEAASESDESDCVNKSDLSKEDAMGGSLERTRLVTLIGPGGAGKTRLALEVASRLTRLYQDRVRFVSLADIPDARLLSFALAHALQLSSSQTDPMEQAVEWLRIAPTLLILDNFEHLLREEETPGKPEHPFGSAAVVWMRLLLGRVPTLTCLVTSRRLLGLQGEQELSLSSLELPQNATDVTDLHKYASVALYVDRAQRVKPDFALTQANADAVTTLCRRLEGMPLALEMTAAWAKTITPQKMLERMQNQLDLPVSRQRDIPARHRSLRATCKWSYDLLAEDLRQFFMRLSVFRGGCTLEAAESVCGANALEQLARLQEQSLVVIVTDCDKVRYRLLEPLRVFADEKLRGSAERPQTQERFRSFFLALVKNAAKQSHVTDLREWLHQLEMEYDNLRMVLTGCLEVLRDHLYALQLAGALGWFWDQQGYLNEGRTFLQAALADPEAPRRIANPEYALARAGALYEAGKLAWRQNDVEPAITYFEESLRLYEPLDCPDFQAYTLLWLGNAEFRQQRYLKARALFTQALALGQELNNEALIAWALIWLGNVSDDHDRTRAYYLQSLTLAKQIGLNDCVAHCLCNLGSQAVQQNDYAVARTFLRDGLQHWCTLQNKPETVQAIGMVALLAAALGQERQATLLLGALEKLRQEMSIAVTANKHQEYTERISAARASLTEETFRVLWDQSQTMSFDQTVATALEIVS